VQYICVFILTTFTIIIQRNKTFFAKFYFECIFVAVFFFLLENKLQNVSILISLEIKGKYHIFSAENTNIDPKTMELKNVCTFLKKRGFDPRDTCIS